MRLLAIGLSVACVTTAPASQSRPHVRSEVAAASYPAPTELYYKQKVDHFNPEDARTWKQRYLLNKDNWNGQGRLENGCRGPFLLYTGNEGPIDGFWNISGFVVETLAKSLGALVIFPEQRYYGKSLPFGDASMTAENARFLTTAQVLQDYVEIVNSIKDADSWNCPVIAFGGSYGGTLTALMRATHPATVVGGLAASAELGYYDLAGWKAHGVNEFTFEDVVMKTWDTARPECLRAAKSALAAIDEATTSLVVDTFNTCDEKTLGPGPKSGFFAYVLEGMPQGDYASAGNPVTKACDELLQAAGSAPDLLAAAGKIVKRFFGTSACIPYDIGGPGNTPGDGPGLSTWGFQSCTEALHAFSARMLRNYTFDLSKSEALCRDLWNNTVKPDLGSLSRAFPGGYALAEGSAGVTRLIFSQGKLDPWHGWFQNISTPPAALDIHHIMTEGAHHEDLRLPFDGDRPSVIAARRQEEAIIRRWISEATSRSVMVV